MAATKRVLAMLEQLAEKDRPKHETFWKTFGRVLKEGIPEDHANRDRLARLLRFSSTHRPGDEQTLSLADYVGRMKELNRDARPARLKGVHQPRVAVHDRQHGPREVPFILTGMRSRAVRLAPTSVQLAALSSPTSRRSRTTRSPFHGRPVSPGRARAGDGRRCGPSDTCLPGVDLSESLLDFAHEPVVVARGVGEALAGAIERAEHPPVSRPATGSSIAAGRCCCGLAKTLFAVFAGREAGAGSGRPPTAYRRSSACQPSTR